jgi:hypothetical protein
VPSANHEHYGSSSMSPIEHSLLLYGASNYHHLVLFEMLANGKFSTLLHSNIAYARLTCRSRTFATTAGGPVELPNAGAGVKTYAWALEVEW